MRNQYTGETLLLAMAQDSFDAGSNRFATLTPLATMQGEPVDASEFPNRDLVWWLVSGAPDILRSRPGRLLVGTIEESREQGTSNPDKDFFQVNFNGVQPAGAGRFIQVIQPSDHASLAPEDVLERCDVRLPYEPTPLALVRLGSRLIGPFRTEAEMEAAGRWRVSFQKASADRPVYVIADSDLTVKRFSTEVSLDGASPQRSNETQTCEYELAVWGDFQAAQARAQTIRLSTEEEAVSRAAKAVLSRSQRQQLVAQFKQLGSASGATLDAADLEILQRVQARMDATTRGVENFIDAVVASGRLADRIDEKVQAEVQRQVEARSATLNAQAEERAKTLIFAVEEKSKELAKLSAETDRQRRHASAELEAELARKRADLEEELAGLRSRLDRQREEIEQQRSLVEQSLSSVVERFESGRQALISDFLAIQPILERAGLGVSSAHTPSIPPSPVKSEPPAASPIILPASLASELLNQEVVTEESFFQRFRDHVEACGFRYELADLVAFHLSVKCTDFVVVGGVSGTGKSSLPKLYAQALAGDGGGDSERFLNVDVSPSWTNPADVLGYINLLDRRFHPAASGIFGQLAFAALEAEAKRGDEGPYLICLDEMNLAQVEHYFSGFIQALSRAPGHRRVTVFDATSLDPEDPLRRWASLPIGENVRFVGTVNFDETTKPLSQRVLDRADLIALEPRGLVELNGTASTARGAPAGPPIRNSDLRAWISERPLPPEAVALLADLQEYLSVLGCPLTPRRQAAIQRFVSSAPAFLCSPEEAIDMQLAQRVMPQLKGLFRAEARAALDRIAETIGRQNSDFERTMRMISQLRDANDEFNIGWRDE